MFFNNCVPTRHGAQKPQLSCAKNCAKLRWIASKSRCCPNTSNDPPVAAADSYSLAYGATLAVPSATGVLANDFDVDSPLLRLELVTDLLERAGLEQGRPE